MRKFLIITIVILSVILMGLVGFIVYDTTHFYVDGQAYAYYAKNLDLRDEDISLAHYQAVQSQLPDCEILWNVPLSEGTFSSDSTELTLTDPKNEDLYLLAEYFPYLVQIDASACSDYAMVEKMADTLSHCSVLYQVDLGSTKANPKETALTLMTGDYDYDVLMENLVHLPRMESIHFPKSELTQQQMEDLCAAYPDIAITGTVELLGKEYDSKTVSLDLSAMTSAEVDAAAGKLGMLHDLESVELMSAGGVSKLTLEDVQKLQIAAPNAKFHYVFDFYGITVSSLDEEVIVKGVNLDDAALSQNLRLALSVMENCGRFVLESKSPYDKMWNHIDHKTLGEIREEYRGNAKLVWRVYFGEDGSSLTDAQVLRAVYGLTDDNSHNLIYCENVRYLDLGHNEYLDYMEFLSGMKDLEVAILSGAPLKDLSPIAACKNLKFLELANCIYLPNIDALAECTQLEMLNISVTKISDISALEGLKLTHLNTINNNVPEEDIEAFIEKNPDCWTVTSGNHYGMGWRTDENDKYLPWYGRMVKAFHYPNAYNNLGWYLPDDEDFQ